MAVVVTERDFLDADEELIPSVSAGELAHYEKVRAMFEGGRGENNKQTGAGRPSSRGSRPGTAGSLKGKGKAVADEPVVVNGKASKGKGKAVAGFQDATASDDDDLY